MAGQDWFVNLLPNRNYIVHQQSKEFLPVYILQVVIATVVVLFILLMNNRHIVLDSVVNERTKSLKKR